MKESNMSKGNSPAFPCQDKDKQIWTGMNLRDYFALEAMNAYMRRNGPIDSTDIAKVAYQVSDAMLEQRAKYP